jgi:hypothetical protein
MNRRSRTTAHQKLGRDPESTESSWCLNDIQSSAALARALLAED